MSWWIWIVVAVLVLFAIAAGKILSTTESHDEKTEFETVAPLDFRHTIFSYIFYPIGFFTFVFTVRRRPLGGFKESHRPRTRFGQRWPGSLGSLRGDGGGMVVNSPWASA